MDSLQRKNTNSAQRRENIFGENNIFVENQESAAQSVLELFPEPFRREFEQNISHGAVEVGGLRSIPYDQNTCPPIAPKLLPTDVSCQDIFARLAVAEGGFGFVDACVLWLDVKSDRFANTGTLLYVPEQGFVELLDQIFPGHGMTTAERRVLAQVVCGQSLKQAAAADEVSHETKRSQFKAVSQKTGRNRQVDLCTFILSRLLLKISEEEEVKQPSHEVIRKYHLRFMPAGVRLHVLVDASGHQHRVFDLGPIGGRPIFVLHAQVLPWFRDEDIEALQAQHLRLIWPMRPGALAPEDAYLSSSAHLDKSLQAILCASELFADEKTIDLLGVSSGCFYATEFTARYPDRVNQLFYVSAGYKPKLSHSWLDRYHQGLTKLIRTNSATARVMFYFLAKKFADRAVLAEILKKMFAGSEPDLEVLEREFSKPLTFDAIQIRFASSAKSIYQDFIFYTYPNWQKVAELRNPIFIHGEFDPTHSSVDVEALASAANARFIANSGVGQLHYYQHLPPMLSLVASILDGDTEK